MKNVVEIKHPLLGHSLTILRDENTSCSDFRVHSDIVSKILIVEATKNLQSVPREVQTPLAKFTGKKIKDKVIVVPVLRAGLAMLYALKDFLGDFSVGFVGLERDEKTAIAKTYYKKLPEILSTHKIIVLDPMLATGGSLGKTITALKDKGAQDISFVGIVSAPAGIQKISASFPKVKIITAAVDERLNEQKYIIPGLGDFGDRYFGT